jgi:hypothetical protein
MATDGFSALVSNGDRLSATSGQEFYAVNIAATPNDFARLALRMSRHQRQFEPVADLNRGVGHDFSAARRDVQYEAFLLRHSMIDRNPGRLFVKLPPGFPLYLRSGINSHDDDPSLVLTARRTRRSTQSVIRLKYFRKFPLRLLPWNLWVCGRGPGTFEKIAT